MDAITSLEGSGITAASGKLRHIEVPWGLNGTLEFVLPRVASWQNAQIEVLRPKLQGPRRWNRR